MRKIGLARPKTQAEGKKETVAPRAVRETVPAAATAGAGVALVAEGDLVI